MTPAVTYSLLFKPGRIISRIFSCLGIGILSVLLASCSGGGGGDSENAAQELLYFYPSKIEKEFDQGSEVYFEAFARLKDVSSVSGGYYVVIRDSEEVSLILQDSGGFMAVFRVNRSLAPGNYEGHIDVLLCSTPECTTQFGSPSRIPYKFSVHAVTSDLKTLSPLDGSAAWANFQGDAGHTGYVPVTLDPDSFSRRWDFRYEQGRRQFVEGNGSLIFSTSGFGSPTTLLAVSEHDGQIQWLNENTYQEIQDIGAPSIVGNMVIAPAKIGEGATVKRFDADTGEEISTVILAQDAYWSQVWGLVTSGNYGFLGTHGSTGWGSEKSLLVSFDVVGNEVAWSRSLGVQGQSLPAVDNEYVYAFSSERYEDSASERPMEQGLSVFDKTSGNLVKNIPMFNTVGDMPVLGQDGIVLVQSGGSDVWESNFYKFPVRDRFSFDFIWPPRLQGWPFPDTRLFAFDLVSEQILWWMDDQYFGPMAVADGRIYVPNFRTAQLEVRDQRSGNLIWSWEVPIDPAR